MSQVRKTALAEQHEGLGGRMVEFAGWWMPVQYKGLKEEHNCVRQKVGLFDVSHMGEIRVTGPKSLQALQWLTSNDVSRLQAGEAQYSLLTNFNGGVVDDLIIYCVEPEANYLLCVNAANTEKDFKWITENNKGADVTDESSIWSQIAVQGPKAIQLVESVMADSISDLKGFNFKNVNLEGYTAMVARTGYTGEDGVEIFVPNEKAVELWASLLKKGEELGVQPIGLGARDTLRTEMKYSLYGHEIDDQTNPYEAGLGWVVKLNAKDFIGKDKIQQVKQDGVERKLIGFKMLERGIARQGYTILDSEGSPVGKVTSGTPSPTTGENIGIGFVPLRCAQVDQEFFIEIRTRKIKAQVVETPFIKDLN